MARENENANAQDIRDLNLTFMAFKLSDARSSNGFHRTDDGLKISGFVNLSAQTCGGVTHGSLDGFGSGTRGSVL
jgi:hypothetical protein